MKNRTNIYFASDCHFGIPNREDSMKREAIFIAWLDEIKEDAKELYLLGDIFDFWFEYKTVVPKGYVRLLGKLAEISDAGIPIYYFSGNHDMWLFDYFPSELNITILKEPITKKINGKTFYIGHGDGLGQGDYGYKFIKKVFSNKFCQFLFRWLHPDIGAGLANYFSKKSRLANGTFDEDFLGEEKERLVLFIKETLKKESIDHFIFGHRHLPLDLLVGSAQYINLGEWVKSFSYAKFDGTSLSLEYFRKTESTH